MKVHATYHKKVAFCKHIYFVLSFLLRYMQVGRETDAKQALVKLRGESNMDIVEAEFNRIALNLKAQQKELGIDFLSNFFAVGC